MARDRDWVDYANLASNVAQNAQLNSINNKMRQLAELEAARELRQLQDAALEHLEATIREAVFEYTEQLRDVEGVAESKPVEAYFRAKHLRGLYSAMPQFDSSRFRNYEDKERLSGMQRNCKRLIEACATRMRADEIEACDHCVIHALEREDLIRLITFQEEKERLESGQSPLAAKERELAKIREQQAQLKCPLSLQAAKATRAVLFAAVWVTLIAGMGFAMELFGSKGAFDRFVLSETSGYVGVVFFSAIVVAVIITKAIQQSDHEQLKRQLAAQVATLEAEVKALHEGFRRRESEALSVCKKFGDATLDDYRKLLRERDTLLKHMLGSFVRGLLNEDYYDSLGDPPKKVGRWWRRQSDADASPPPSELEMLEACVGSKNVDQIIRAIRSGTPTGKQAATELYAKLTGAEPNEAQQVISRIAKEIAPKPSGFGLA